MKRIKLGSKGYAVISDQDYEMVTERSWHKSKRGYAVNDSNRNGNRKVIYLHQFILGKKDGFEIDHKNGDKLDNRRENLRYLTRSHNAINSKPRNSYSGVTGVTWFSRDQKWRAHIMINGKQIHLGYFEDKAEAVLARKNFEAKLGL